MEYISVLHLYMLVYITTYAIPKTANATTSKSTPLMNTPFLLSSLLCGFEVNCGLNVDSIIDSLVVNRDEDIVVIDRDGNIVVIDTDEDNITEIKNK